MVKLLIGHKGSGKTGQMVQLANDSVKESNGSIIFINKLKSGLKSKNNFITFGISFLVLFGVYKIFVNNYYNMLILYKFYLWMLVGFVVILIVVIGILKIFYIKNSTN